MILKNHCLQNTSAFCSPSAIVINVYKIICEINFTQSMQNMNRCTTKQIYRNHTFEKLIFDTINVSVVETNEIFKENKSSNCSLETCFLLFNSISILVKRASIVCVIICVFSLQQRVYIEIDSIEFLSKQLNGTRCVLFVQYTWAVGCCTSTTM